MVHGSDEPDEWGEPRPWWESLDVEVKTCTALSKEEGLTPGQPVNYDRAGRVIERFIGEYPGLATSLANRYPEPEEPVEPNEALALGIGMWLMENAVGDRFPRRGEDSVK